MILILDPSVDISTLNYARPTFERAKRDYLCRLRTYDRPGRHGSASSFCAGWDAAVTQIAHTGRLSSSVTPAPPRQIAPEKRGTAY
jgi:hypothetical protein